MTDFDPSGAVVDNGPEGTTIAAYSQTAAALAILEDRYRNATFDLSTKEGMAEAKAARNELRGYRTGLERARTAVKADALDFTRRVDGEAKMIRERLEALEGPIAEQIRAEEERVERERERLEQERQQREAEQAAKIEGFRQSPLALIGAKADAIKDRIAELEGETLEGFDESVLAAALTARDDAIRQLRVMHGAAVQTEEAAAVIARQRAELEEQQRAAEAAEQARREQAAREQAERDRIEQERREAEEAQRRAEQEKRDAELAELRRAEQARQQAEQLALQAANDRRRVVSMLRGYPDRHAGSGVETLKAAIVELKDYALDPVLFADESDRMAAEDARSAAGARLDALLDAAVAKAEEAAQRAREEAEARERATAEAQERERERQEAEAAYIAGVTLIEAARAALLKLPDGSLESRALAAAIAREEV